MGRDLLKNQASSTVRNYTKLLVIYYGSFSIGLNPKGLAKELRPRTGEIITFGFSLSIPICPDW